MTEIILYTTHCPRCKVLQSKLDEAHISYTINEDIEEMLAYGLKSAPALRIGDKILNFTEAVKWVGNQNAI